MKTLNICAKCSDMFNASLACDKQGVIGYYDGYVPNWFPNPDTSHYGDYVQLTIDIETGKILGWKKPTAEDLKIFKKES